MNEFLSNLNGIEFYLVMIVAIIVGVIVIRKVASCLIRTAVIIALVVALIYLYFHFFPL